LSLLQKQPPGSVHSLVVPLQCPKVWQEKPVGVETGQPPSGQGIPESPASAGPAFNVHPASTQVSPSGQTVPQPPQFFESVVVSAQLPLQSLGALDGQLPTQP
jgi:hypothetical protein